MARRHRITALNFRRVLPLPALAVAVVLFAWIGGVLAFRGAKGNAAQDVEVEVAFDRDIPIRSVRLIQVYRSGFSEEVFPASWRKTAGGQDADAAWWRTPPAGRQIRWVVSRRWARDFLIEITDASAPFFRGGYVRIGGTIRHLPPGEGQTVTETTRSRLPPSVSSAEKTVRASALLHATRSAFPWFDGLLNYPGDWSFARWWLREWLSHPFTWVTAIWLAASGLLASWLLRSASRRKRLLDILCGSDRLGLGGNDAVHSTRRGAWFFFLAGLAVILAAAVYLEWRQPRYFLRDDNFSIFFPGILSVGRALSAGQFPEWTPRVFLGMPIAELGVFAATYPGTWISYAISDLLFGSPIWAIDLFCWGHLACGFAACFCVLRRDGIHPSVAAAAGMSWALCGFALIAGRSWYYMTPVFTYLPCIGGMLHSLVRQKMEGPPRNSLLERTWVLRWAIVWGLFFHAGNAQMWLYSIELFALWAAWAGYRGLIGAREAMRLVRGTLLGLAIAAPLLISQFLAVRSADRPPGPDHGIEDAVGAMLLPYPFAACPGPSDWADPSKKHAGHFYYSGTLFAVAWLLSSAAAMGTRGFRRKWSTDPWVPVGLAALWLAMGNEGGLWWLQSRLPVFGAVYHPFKYLPLLHLAMLCVGARVVHRLLFDRSDEPRRRHDDGSTFADESGAVGVLSYARKAAATAPLPFFAAQRRAMALFAASSLLLTWHVLHADTTFYTFGDTDYVALPPRMAEILHPGTEPARVTPISPFRSPAHHFVWGLGLNFPIVYRLESIDGYGEFVRQTVENREVEMQVRRNPPDALRAYGVTHLVLHRCAVEPCLSGSREARRAETETLFGDLSGQDWFRDADPVFHNESVAIFALDGATPRAFGTPLWDVLESIGGLESPAGKESMRSRVALPVRVEETRVIVETAALTEGGDVTVNYLHRPRMRVWIDGRPAAPTADERGRLTVRIPAGAREVIVGYAGAWGYGWLVAGGLSVVFVVVGWMQRTVGGEGSPLFSGKRRLAASGTQLHNKGTVADSGGGTQEEAAP